MLSSWQIYFFDITIVADAKLCPYGVSDFVRVVKMLCYLEVIEVCLPLVRIFREVGGIANFLVCMMHNLICALGWDYICVSVNRFRFRTPI